MAKKNEPQVVSIARCKRIVRPLVSKIHSLTDVHSKYPAKLEFDVGKFKSHGASHKDFAKPPTSNDRLLQLKPFLSAEAFEGYTEVFSIFKSIVQSLNLEIDNDSRELVNKKPRRGSRAKVKSGLRNMNIPSLTDLAARKLGKSIALNTKSTHYSLNQTALFDPASIPLHLRKFHDQLADDIDAWLEMEPQSVFGQHRSVILLGYVLHLLVFNSRTLFYTLIPVICHWLHEQNLSNSRSLFMEYWLSSDRDPDHEDVQELAISESSRDSALTTFWLFHDIGYWQELVSLLGIKSIEYSTSNAYEALFIEALVSSKKIDLAQVDMHEIYAVLRRNLQHPKNTKVMCSVLANFITRFYKEFHSASTSTAAQEAIEKCYSDVRHMIQAWLSLSKNCVFNSMDLGNNENFDSCNTIILHLAGKCKSVLAYLVDAAQDVPGGLASTIKEFQTLEKKILNLHQTFVYLQAFFLDTRLSKAYKNQLSRSMCRYFWDFVAVNCDDDTMEDFIEWLELQEKTGPGGLVPALREAMSIKE